MSVDLLEYQRVCNQRAMLIGAICEFGSTLREALDPDRYLLEQRRELVRFLNALEDKREEAIAIGSSNDGGADE